MKPRWLHPLPVVVATVIGFQLATAAAGKSYYLTQMTMAVYYAVVAVGLSLVMGYAGQISLGHGAFFAMGGYISALLTTHDLAAWKTAGWVRWLEGMGVLVVRPNLYEVGDLLTVAPWAAFGAALAVTGGVAVVIGFPSLRLKGLYLAMATLGFGLIVYRIVLGNRLLGAADGITGVPEWSLGFGLSVSGRSGVRVSNYYLAWALALGVVVLLQNIVGSRVGRALRAIHDRETAANAMGVNTARVKLQAFVVSAVLAAAAGSFLTHYNQGIGPSEASALKSVRYVALVAAGGMANLWGTLLVSTALNFLSLRGYFGTYDHAVFGVLLIVIIALAPEGPLRPLGEAMRRAWRSVSGGKEAGRGAA
ncbi:MAG TPA: branched-chain amino acid ABC transporter permease [Verrucomicrobiota bacterium]|nr:branched-chain amino acid ABC transporter permease [Verrucomicrobiota bacterium]HNU52254.1 branched-chain amino acid ABC transporter permease [Verrucomicrobiota bacterium]